MFSLKSWSQYTLFWLLLATLVRGVVYSVIVPLWEFPDEQAHFAQVSYYVEKGLDIPLINLSEEILISEQIMGTERDEMGINNYTYHPEYRPEYSTGLNGLHERMLNDISIESRKLMLKKEAARYPALFYLYTALFYLITYPFSILIRVFASRLASVVLTTLSVGAGYQLGKDLFDSKFSGHVMASMLAFHPMFSFLGSGVNNDNLMNLIGLMILVVLIRIYKKGLNTRYSLALGLLCGLGVVTKQLAIPLILASGLILVMEWIKTKRSLNDELSLLAPLVVVGLVSGGWLFVKIWITSGKIPFVPGVNEEINPAISSIGEYIPMQVGRYYRETLVWYWGVYKWLGVILPLNVIRLIKVLMLVSGVGLVTFLFKKRKLMKLELASVLVLVSLIYWLAITAWDYLKVTRTGVSHGLQGRYFFPTIGAHMGLLLLGWLSLVPRKWVKKAGFVVVLVFVYLNLVSMKVLVENYYDTRNIWNLWMQMSQYKAWFLKYPFSLLWIGGYALVLVKFVGKLLEASKQEK